MAQPTKRTLAPNIAARSSTSCPACSQACFQRAILLIHWFIPVCITQGYSNICRVRHMDIPLDFSDRVEWNSEEVGLLLHEEPVQLVEGPPSPPKSRFNVKVGSPPLHARGLPFARVAPLPFRLCSASPRKSKAYWSVNRTRSTCLFQEQLPAYHERCYAD